MNREPEPEEPVLQVRERGWTSEPWDDGRLSEVRVKCVSSLPSGSHLRLYLFWNHEHCEEPMVLCRCGNQIRIAASTLMLSDRPSPFSWCAPIFSQLNK